MSPISIAALLQALMAVSEANEKGSQLSDPSPRLTVHDGSEVASGNPILLGRSHLSSARGHVLPEASDQIRS